MAEAFAVDPDALTETLQRMAAFQRYAEEMLAEVDSVAGRLHATWSGAGAAAHAEAHRRWTRGEAMMRAALAQLKAAGATAHANYTDVAAVNLAMWS